MYGIGGETDLTEHTLDHLSGYRDSRPVRIGNGAYDQQQHDVWGMLLDAVGHAPCATVARWRRRSGKASPASSTPRSQRCHEPDQGIWEMRGEPQHFVASKVMCWVAADRGRAPGANRATTHERAETLAEGRRRDARPRSRTKGVDDRGVFTQHYDTDDLDASTAADPDHGLPARPTTSGSRATVLAIADELTKDGLVLRYRVETTDDGLSGEEGTFTICSFWLVSALAIIGEVDRARALFEKLLSFAGPLLLYAEEIDVDDRPAPRQLPAGVHPPRADRRRQAPHRRRANRRVNDRRMSHRVVVVGGGFGGLPACRFLGHVAGVEVTLLDRRNHHLFQPLLYQVATGILSPGQIAPPLRHVLRKLPERRRWSWPRSPGSTSTAGSSTRSGSRTCRSRCPTTA